MALPNLKTPLKEDIEVDVPKTCNLRGLEVGR